MPRGDQPGDWIRWWHRKALSDPFMTLLPIAWEGAYRRLLDYNAGDGSIPNNKEELAQLCKMTPEEFAPCWKHIRKKFSTAHGCRKRLTNVFVLAELDHQKDVSRARSEAAKSRKKKAAGSFPQAALAQQLQSKSTTNATDIEEEVEGELEREKEQDPTTSPPARARAETPNSRNGQTGSPDVWWNTERAELDCSPDFAVSLEATYPTIRRERIREKFIKFSLMLADPEKPERLNRLVHEHGVGTWFKARLREDFARELAAPQNADERMSDQQNDRRRREGW